MTNLDQLADKIRRAARDLVALKQENRKLNSEVEMLRTESVRYHALKKESERTRKEQDLLKGKLERLNKKLEKMLSVELTLTDAQ